MSHHQVHTKEIIISGKLEVNRERPQNVVLPNLAFSGYRIPKLLLSLQVEKNQRSTATLMLQCKYCMYTTSVAKNMKNHRKSHDNLKPFSCPECDYKCTQNRLLTRHFRRHTGEKPYLCTECDYASAYSPALKVHMRTHTGEKPFSCAHCDYRSIHGGHLKEHMRTHTGEKPYSCLSCEAKFSRSTHLVRHIMTHTGEKPFSCSICSYKCARAAHLKRHMRKHTGEKPFKCLHCSYKCTQSSHLKLHLKTHQAKKDKRCDFDWKQSLDKENSLFEQQNEEEEEFDSDAISNKSANVGKYKERNGEKRYACAICDCRYARPYSLKLHIKSHLEKKPFTCNKCEFITHWKGNLTIHKRKSHNNEN